MHVIESPQANANDPMPVRAMPQEASPQQQSFWPEILDYLLVVRKYWLLFLATAGILGAVVVFVGLQQDKVYRATNKVLIDYTTPKVLKEGDDIYQMSHHVWEYQRYFETQPTVITSREVLQEVVATLGLAEDEDFLGVSELEDGAEKREFMAQIDPVKILRNHITIKPLEESLALEIMVTDRDPTRAADIANEVANAYIDYYLKQRQTTTSTAGEWLDERVVQLRNEVSESEDAMVTFQRQNDFLGTSLEDSMNLANERILSLNKARTQAELDYLMLNARWERAEQMVEQQDTGAIPEILDNLTIQKLKAELYQISGEESSMRARYGDKMPQVRQLQSQRQEVQDQIDIEQRRVLASIEAELETMDRQRAELTSDLDRERTIAMDLRQKEMDYHRLARDLDQTEELYKRVNDRSLETDLAGMLQYSNISVLDRATPPSRHFKPKLRLILPIALVLGLGAALLVVFVIDRMDTIVRSPEQLQSDLGLPVMGIHPRFPKAAPSADGAPGGEDGQLIVATSPKGAVAESCRTIRTNLLFMTPGQQLQSLVVTSAGPSEGKTNLAAHLSHAMASMNSRILLVDTDMRRPRVHKVFGLDKKRGLSSVLIDEVRLEDAIRPSGYANLDLLPLGNIPPNPAELINSGAFRKLVDQLQTRYDHVIFDSPPVMAVADTSILAQYVDGVLMVARQDKTNRHALRQAVKTLQNVNARVLGFVLNDVDLEAVRKGYYSYQYRHSYYYHTYQYSGRYEEEEQDQQQV